MIKRKIIKSLLIISAILVSIFIISSCGRSEEEEREWGYIKVRWGMEIEEVEKDAAIQLKWESRNPDVLTGEREFDGLKFQATYQFTIGKLTSINYTRYGRTDQKFKTAFFKLQKELEKTYGEPTSEIRLFEYKWVKKNFIIHHKIDISSLTFSHVLEFSLPESMHAKRLT